MIIPQIFSILDFCVEKHLGPKTSQVALNKAQKRFEEWFLKNKKFIDFEKINPYERFHRQTLENSLTWNKCKCSSFMKTHLKGPNGERYDLKCRICEKGYWFHELNISVKGHENIIADKN